MAKLRTIPLRPRPTRTLTAWICRDGKASCGISIWLGDRNDISYQSEEGEWYEISDCDSTWLLDEIDCGCWSPQEFAAIWHIDEAALPAPGECYQAQIEVPVAWMEEG